jgi:tetratricopeptide (TPR) repeat protein
VFFKKRDLDNAEKCAARACELDPGQSDYLALQAAVRFERRPLGAPVDDLVDLLDAALSKNDRCERAYFTRAQVRKRMGRVELAMKDFKEVCELNPSNLDAARELRIYEMRKSKLPSAAPPQKSPSSSPIRKLSGFLASSLSNLPRKSTSTGPVPPVSSSGPVLRSGPQSATSGQAPASVPKKDTGTKA